MMDPNSIDYYIIDCAIPSIITIEKRYQIDFGNPDSNKIITLFFDFVLEYILRIQFTSVIVLFSKS
mgnify:CR=1 FL=1